MTRTFNSDGEVERKVFRIPGVVLQEYESLVKVRMEGRKVVQEALLLAEPIQHRLSVSDYESFIHGDVRTFAGKKSVNPTSISTLPCQGFGLMT